MKTILRAQHKRARKSAFQKTMFAVLFLGSIGLLNYFNVNPFSNVSHGAASSVWKVKEGTQRELNDFYSLFRSKQSLVLENNKLEQSLLEKEHLDISIQALRSENRELKQMLNRDIEESSVMGAVLSRPNTSPYDTLIIDIGAESDVHVGDKVVALGDFVVGFISKVFRNTSQVTLYSSPGIKTNVLIGESNIPASAEGRGANNFVVQLPRDTEVVAGDIVVLSDFDTQIFGQVQKIERTSTDAFQLVYFTNPINVFNTKWVQIITQTEL